MEIVIVITVVKLKSRFAGYYTPVGGGVALVCVI